MITKFNFKDRTIKSYAIRKLTCKECFRLMGVRDAVIHIMQSTYEQAKARIEKWIGKGIKSSLSFGEGKGGAPVISASQQYKQAGNSIVVDVLAAIYEQLWYPKPRKPKQQLDMFDTLFADEALPPYPKGYEPMEHWTKTLPPHPLPLKGGGVDTDTPQADNGNQTPSPSTGEGERSGGEGLFLYRGYPFPSLIQKYIEMFCDGEEPCEGDTNVKTFEMARTFAPILAYSVEELKKVIPHYNSEARTTPFSYEEYVQCLQNAVGNEQKRGGMPYRLRQVLKAMDAEKGKATKMGKFLKTLPPEPPKRMCSLHKLLAENVHSEKHKAVIYDLNAPLLAHLHGVQFRATDNTLWTPSQMQILCARQSSGKGCVNEVIDAVMEDIQRSDDAMNQRLKAWKEKQRKEKTKSPRPQDIYRQILSYDTTNAALTQMNIDAYQNGQRSLYGKYNEIELLYKMRSTGKGIDDLLRINFDHDILSQGRVGTDSVDGGCPLHWNFNASTTPTGLLDFVKEKMIVNGTLSRLHLMTFIVEEGRQKQMTFGNYDEAWKARLKPYIDNLNNASGVVECPQANKVCQQLYDENDDMADMYESEAFRVIGYRAVKLAWARTMVLYIAEGYRWSRQLADYMRWSWQRDMWTKMYYVGEQVEALMNSEREIGGKGPQNLLSLLPDEFSEADYQQMRREQGKQGDGKSTLRTWKTRGYIDYDEVAKVWVKK